MNPISSCFSSPIWDKHHPKSCVHKPLAFCFTQFFNIYMNSLKLFYYSYFYFIKWLSSCMKIWVLAFQILYIKLLRFIHTVSCPWTSLLWLLYKVQLCEYNTIYSYTLPQMAIWSVSSFLPLWTVLLWTLFYISFCSSSTEVSWLLSALYCFI